MKKIRLKKRLSLFLRFAWERGFELFYSLIILYAMYIGAVWLRNRGNEDYSAYLTGFAIMFCFFTLGRLFRKDPKE